MEKETLKEDIQLICVRATSFPDGILAAYQKLEQIEPSIRQRTFYGISHGSKNGIIYWAAVEEKSNDEAEKWSLEKYTIKRGVYAAKTLKNFRGNEHKIGLVFEQLLKNPKLDTTAECVEWHKGINEVQCMVRLTE